LVFKFSNRGGKFRNLFDPSIELTLLFASEGKLFVTFASRLEALVAELVDLSADRQVYLPTGRRAGIEILKVWFGFMPYLV